MTGGFAASNPIVIPDGAQRRSRTLEILRQFDLDVIVPVQGVEEIAIGYVVEDPGVNGELPRIPEAAAELQAVVTRVGVDVADDARQQFGGLGVVPGQSRVRERLING